MSRDSSIALVVAWSAMVRRLVGPHLCSGRAPHGALERSSRGSTEGVTGSTHATCWLPLVPGIFCDSGTVSASGCAAARTSLLSVRLGPAAGACLLSTGSQVPALLLSSHVTGGLSASILLSVQDS